MPKDLLLKNLNVVHFESRLAGTISDLVRLQGGDPFSAPSMKEVPLENNPEAFGFADELFRGTVDLLILLTGVGTRTLVSVLETRYPREKILEALRRTAIVPRGPKPIRVLKELGVPFAFTVPEPNTWREILKTLDENSDLHLSGKTVAVQEYGVTNAELIHGLETRGANVLRVPVYRWTLPDDTRPMEEAIRGILDGRFQVAMFTTAVQIEHLLRVAERMNTAARHAVPLLVNALNEIVIASVGPDCSEALRPHGLRVDIEPKIPKMGPLVVETAKRASELIKIKQKTEDRRQETEKDKKIKNSQIPSSVLRPPSSENHSVVSGLQSEAIYKESAFMKACRCEPTPFTPVWLMRQAGRYMKDYRSMREKVPFLELCKDKDLVTEITVSAQEKIGADAAIIFSDILLVVEPMGLDLRYLKGDGPTIQKAVRTANDVERLREVEPEEALEFVFEAIRQTRTALKPGVPLIGFAGAPFTLASYMIEGGASKDFAATRHLMVSEETTWRSLMEKISGLTVKYLKAQIAAGVQAVQLFDSWVGALSADEYRKYVLPYSAKVISGLEKKAPLIHFGTGTGAFLELVCEAGGEVIGVDHRVRLDEAWRRLGHGRAIQGNLDPAVLLRSAPQIKKEVQKILDAAAGRPGHIFNLGHGVLPGTPEENVVALVQMVHDLSRR